MYAYEWFVSLFGDSGAGAAFVVVLLKKWGVAEYMQVHGDRFTSQLFSCDFCMSWWASVLVMLLSVSFVGDNAVYMLAPVLATPIARYLV